MTFVYSTEEVDALVTAATAPLHERIDVLAARVAKLETAPPPVVDPPPVVIPPPVVTPPASGDYGIPTRPFSADSPWNQPATAFPRLETASGPVTQQIRKPLAQGGTTGINFEQYSIPVYVAKATDPEVTITDVVHGSWSIKCRIPAGAIPATGTDGNFCVIQPDGRVIDVFRAKPASGGWNVDRIGVTSITGKGIGPASTKWTPKMAPAGIRAAGCSTLGGLITTTDIASGRIRHALAMNLPGAFFKNGGRSTKPSDGHLDADGYGIDLGYIYPATEQDNGSSWGGYQGAVPMGTRAVIPATVDVTKLGLSPEALMIARAAQEYGVIFADMSGWGDPRWQQWSMFYVDPAAPVAWVAGARGSDWNQLNRVRQQLVAVAASVA